MGISSQARAAACGAPFKITELINSAPFGGGGWTSQPVINSGVCSPARAVVDGNGVTHVFVMDQNNHLIEAYQQVIGGSWTILDITNQLNGVTIQGVPAPLATGGPAVQVFVPNSSGHLLSFVNPGNEIYQVFDLSTIAGSSAQLVSLACPALIGTTVHVMVSDRISHLHDFYKPQPVQWTDHDFTASVGIAAVNPGCYFYSGAGGSFLQMGARSPSNNHLVFFAQGVNADGTFNGNPNGGDITSVTGKTTSSLPSPVVVGSTLQDVAIFADDGLGHLIDFFKAPNPVQWVALDRASPLLGRTALSPTALFFQNVGTNGTVKVYSAVLGSGVLHIFEYTGDPTTGALTGVDIDNGGTILSDPYAVVNAGVIEVFIPN